MLMKLLEQIEHQYALGLPFVAYRKPNDTTFHGFFQHDDTLCFTDTLEEEGFVFAPFDATQKAILIPKAKASFYSEVFVLRASEDHNASRAWREDEANKAKHIRLVKEAIAEINTTAIAKIVISRSEAIPVKDVVISLLFESLMHHYPTAFVYVWYHPKVGLWLGATPETLVHFQHPHFQTMSLAATQVYKDTVAVTWGAKELEEQALVTQFITDQLHQITSTLDVRDRETIKAGNLLHLKTAVHGSLSSTANLKDLVQALHPTPAVCGLPREAAKDFILRKEGYDRQFYTGYLGELNMDNATRLYVNLRCMQLHDNNALLYVGGGITEASDPVKEWEETVAKSATLKTISH